MAVPPLYVLLGFIASITVLATLWSRFFQRGPLEWLMGKATGLARCIDTTVLRRQERTGTSATLR
ncbi:DUF418 domain-containing protein [Streptomyces massasporeus]|uniref:DUF418 domain-containing protein n=1 Tax=Streptomyces massasporeus TaxID=67324 RepID=UPI0033F57526